MKNKKVFPVLFAVVALIISTLACSFGSEPGVSNIRMTTDDSGETSTTSYPPTDDFYVFFDVSGMDVGTPFEGRWFALNIEGEDPNTPFSTIEYNLEDGVGQVYFQLYSDVDWPVGNYRVDIYMNGEKVGEQEFSVQ
jgi:hypothetical protein